MSEQRLSVTFGAFSCDVVGYDDPFSILNRVVQIFSEIAKANPAFGAGEVGMSDMERAQLAAGLSDQASRIEELADQSSPSGLRYVVSNTEAVEERASEKEIAAEEEVIIAAEADDDAVSGDLELRDTLEAADAPGAIAEEETVALDVAPTPALSSIEASDEFETLELEASEPAVQADIEAAPENAVEDKFEELDAVVVNAFEAPEETVTEALQAPEADFDEAFDEYDEIVTESRDKVDAVIADAVEEAEAALEQTLDDARADIAQADIVQADIAEELDEIEAVLPVEGPDAEPLILEAAPEAADEEKAAVKPDEEKAVVDAEPKAADQPAPLRLNIGSVGVEPASPAKAEKPAPEPVSEKPQQRVTITKLPLRPDVKKAPEQIAANLRHALTPVQKVEPVVTMNTTISSFSDEAPRPSRAERLRARMEQRNQADDGENFLFADVAEPKPAEPADDKAREDQAEAPLTLRSSFPSAEPTPEPKPRRSLARLLGFGKKAGPEPERDVEPPLELQTPIDPPQNLYGGDAAGFDRLRESVAAKLPAAEEPPLEPVVAPAEPRSISEAIDYDGKTSPTSFARSVGATTLQDLLEASAAYIDLVEGKSRFSRRDVMQALHQIDADSDYSQEARLKSFRKLLTTGSLVRVDDGMFTVSQATRYGYESQLQAS